MALVAVALLPASASAGMASQSFADTGGEQHFVVPNGVTQVTVTATGAAGQGGSGFLGGQADKVVGTLPVSPGSTLYIEVGGVVGGCDGGGAAGGNGAGAGGGATDVRTIPIGTAGSCGSRQLVAGGGGGAGAPGLAGGGGNGGNAGGSNACTSVADGTGGAGAGASLLSGPGGGGGGGYNGGAGGGPGGGGGGGSDCGGTGASTSDAPSVTITYNVAASTVTLSLSPTTVQANGTDTTTATVTEADSDGTPVLQEPPMIVASDPGVRVGPVTEVGNGTYTATLTASTHAGAVTVTAGDPASGAFAQATLTQTAGPAANISVSVNPTSIRADGSSTATVTATVTDAHSNPKSSEDVSVTSSDPGERLSPVTNQGGGLYTTTVTSSTQIHQVTITAADGSLRATTTLNQAGFPTSLLVTVAPTEVPADGSSTATATALVRDAASEPMAGQPVTFTTSDPGVGVSSVTDHGDGTYTVTLTSSTVAHQVTVSASDGGLSGSATLTELTPPTPPVPPVSPPPPQQPHASTAVFMGALPAGGHGALVALRCVNGGEGSPCNGTVSLTVVRRGRLLMVGRAVFEIGAGQNRTVSVSLSRRGRLLLRQSHGRLTVALRLNSTQVRLVRLIAAGL